jgi:hypothetical protein
MVFWHGMAWRGFGHFWNGRKGHRYGTWIVSCIAGATFLLFFFLLLRQLRLYDSFLAGQSTFTLKGEFYFTSLLHRKLKKNHFILRFCKKTQNKTRTKHTYNLKRYTLPMQTSKRKKTTQPSK